MTFPAARPRSRFHTRKFTYECFRREDGLWDIDAEISDTKDYDFALHSHVRPAAEPIHRMLLRLTVDDDLTIHEVFSTTVHSPFPDCVHANDPMKLMVGARIGPGWRAEIDKRMGGVKGCTHLRDLLFSAATAAFQGIASHSGHLIRLGRLEPEASATMPSYLGKCMIWSLHGDAVKRYEPAFFVPPPQESVE